MARERVHCDQCEMLSINGVPCHETGCPNSGKTWEDGEWVKYFKCFECGYDVREGEHCDCGDIEGELDQADFEHEMEDLEDGLDDPELEDSLSAVLGVVNDIADGKVDL